MAPQRVLVTGANGFIGTHVVQQLLSAGHKVRAVVRSEAKIENVKKDHPKYLDLLDFSIVPDLEKDGAYDEAIKSDPPFTAVLHLASPFHYGAEGSNKEIYLDPAVRGTTNILKAIQQHAPTVKKVVITSSFAAVINAKIDNFSGHVYTEKDWNTTTWDEALTGNQGVAYLASKLFAEKAGWDFIKENQVNFDLTVLNPPMVYGPIAHSVASVKDLNTSTARIYNLFISKKSSDPLPDNGFWLYVDVRDLAHAHVLAITDDKLANKRILITNGQVSSQEISDILRSGVPELKDRVPVGTPGKSSLEPGAYNVDNSLSKEVGVTYTPIEKTFVDFAKQSLELEKL